MLFKLRNLFSHSDMDNATVPWGCYSGYYCGVNDPLPTLGYVYKSVHLEEAGLITPIKYQDGCGSCWAFAATCQLENAILNMKNLSDFWLNETRKPLDLSEIWAVANIHGFSKGCTGGDSVSALHWFLEYADSVELESNYNYAEMFEKYVIPEGEEYEIIEELEYKIEEENYLRPLAPLIVDDEAYAAVALNVNSSGTNNDIIK